MKDLDLSRYHEQLALVEDAAECTNESLDGLAFLAFQQANASAHDPNAAHLAQELLGACEQAKVAGEKVAAVLSVYSSLESYLSSMPGVATAAGSSKTVKWSGAVKLVQEDPGNVYSVFLDDVFVCTLKENSPSMSALAAELDLDLAADEQEILRKWAGPLEFKQVGDTPLFDFFLGKIFLAKLTSNSPQGKDLEEMLLINLVELVDPKFKRSDDDWRVYPTEKEKAEREAKKAEKKLKQAASLKTTAAGPFYQFYQKVLPVLKGSPYRMYSNESGPMAHNGIAEMLIVKKEDNDPDYLKAFRLNFNEDGTFTVDNLGLQPPQALVKKIRGATLMPQHEKMASKGSFRGISLRVPVSKIQNFDSLPAKVKEFIKSADHIESRGFQELLGYSEDNTIIWSAGGYWDDREFIAKNFGSMAKDKIQWAVGSKVAKAAIKNPGNQKTLDDIDGLSDGTFSSLTNIKNGMQISKLQTAFGNFVYSLDKDAGTWHNAWSLWMKKLGVTEHKRGMVDGKELWVALFGEDIRGSIKNAVSSLMLKAGNIAEPKLEKFAIVDCYGDPVSDYLFDSEKEAEEVLEDAIEANDEEWEDYAIEKVTSGFVEESNKRIEQLKKLYPKAYENIDPELLAEGLNSVWALKAEDGSTFLFLDTPGHGWLFDLNGKMVGEEDAGFAVPLQKYNKELDKMFASQEMVISSAKPTLKEVVKGLMSDERFQKSLPSLIEAAELASQVALKKGKDDALLFNSLCIDFLTALKDKKLSPAMAAAEELVAAGHGEAFLGL